MSERRREDKGQGLARERRGMCMCRYTRGGGGKRRGG